MGIKNYYLEVCGFQFDFDLCESLQLRNQHQLYKHWPKPLQIPIYDSFEPGTQSYKP